MNSYFTGRYIICLYIPGYFTAIWKASEKKPQLFSLSFVAYRIISIIYSQEKLLHQLINGSDYHISSYLIS